MDGLKEYTISEKKYTGENAKFGEKEIITLKPESTGNKRFYVMALKDFATEAYTDSNNSNNSYPAYTQYYWYKNAYGKMNSTGTNKKFGTRYANTNTIIRIWNNNGEEEGWATGATQDNQDIWKHIQKEYSNGWYIPSLGEWVAFADYLKEEQSLTNNCSTSSCNDNGNYDDKFGLSDWYWSSSQIDANYVWNVYFDRVYMGGDNIDNINSVRLGATF